MFTQTNDNKGPLRPFDALMERARRAQSLDQRVTLYERALGHAVHEDSVLGFSQDNRPALYDAALASMELGAALYDNDPRRSREYVEQAVALAETVINTNGIMPFGEDMYIHDDTAHDRALNIRTRRLLTAGYFLLDRYLEAVDTLVSLYGPVAGFIEQKPALEDGGLDYSQDIVHRPAPPGKKSPFSHPVVQDGNYFAPLRDFFVVSKGEQDTQTQDPANVLYLPGHEPQ